MTAPLSFNCLPNHLPGVGRGCVRVDRDRSTCTAGTTSQAYADATILRVNYFRAMAGLQADVVLSNAWNLKAQDAALMMSAQGALSG